MIDESRSELVLAIRPFARGYAFAVFEGALSPIDWGVKEIRGGNRNARSLAAAQDLITTHQRRSRRIRRLHGLLVNYAEGQSVEIRRYSRESIEEAFKPVGARSRYEIAQAIAARIGAFENKLPPVRRGWQPEDPRMALFDAVSLALTQYAMSERETRN